MRANTQTELGRVVGVNTRRYTIDVITESGRVLRDVPFVSPYSKGASNGQGFYMMPEVDSYTLVKRTVSLRPGELYGTEVYCENFFNPIDNRGSFSGGRENLSPGDGVWKTSAGNKILLTTDGVIHVYSSDLAQIRLFPASGNVKDSAGLDHLLQILIENFDFYTGGGRWEWRVNKKAGETNFRYEYRSRPLLEHNPDLMIGNIGSQGALGDKAYFHTWERFNTSQDGAQRILRAAYWEKTDGEVRIERREETGILVVRVFENNRGDRERLTLNPQTEEPYTQWSEDRYGNKVRITYDESGTIQHKIDLKASGEILETHYQAGEKVWEYTRAPDGSTRRTHYLSGEKTQEETIAADGRSVRSHYSGGTQTWKSQVDPDGTTGVFIPADGDKAKVTISPQGEMIIEVDQDFTVKSKKGNLNIVAEAENILVQALKDLVVQSDSGNITVESKAAEVLVKAAVKALVDAPEIELAGGSLGKLMVDTAISVFNSHTHDSGVFGVVTGPPLLSMTPGTHSSTKVSTG